MSEKPQDIGLDSKSPAERDQIDLNHEISGEPTGRIQRFLSENSHDIYGENEKKKAERRYRSMLQMLLAEDPQYAALYSQVTKNLDKAYQAVGQALIDINQRLEDSDRKLQFLRDNTAEMEDGTKIFLSNEGSIFTEDGKRLSNEEAQKYSHLDNLQSWDEYKAEKEVYDTASRQQVEVETYQRDVLDHARERLNDEDNPALKDELEDLDEQIKSAMPDFATQYHTSEASLDTSASYGTESLSAAQNLHGKPDLSTPDVTAAFDKARYDIPDLSDVVPTESAPISAPAV